MPQSTLMGQPRRYRALPRWLRLVSTVLVPVYALTSFPGYLLAEADEVAKEISHAVAESLKPAPPVIRVNHTLPAGVVDDDASPVPQAQPGMLHFSSANPKDGEFFQARLFAEPLVPTSNTVAMGENAALAQALAAFAQAGTKPSTDAAERVVPLRQFLAEHPTSRWGLALWLNLGLTYRKAGYWTRALEAWEQAWTAGKKTTLPAAHLLADRAVAELAELNARLGRYERLAPLFEELDASGRDLRGAAADKLAGARQGLWMMDHEPELSFRCGPMALNCLRLAQDPKAGLEEKLFSAKSTRQGISLDQVAALSREIKRPMQMAFRTADKQGKGAGFITPAVVHWKAGHYAALVEGKEGRYRVDDPTFGDTNWVSQAALEAETDGYFLLAANLPLPTGWKSVMEAEGAKVWGKGTTGAKDPNATKCSDVRIRQCPQCGRGMATYNVEAMLTSLSIGDTPLSYAPPRGAPIDFSVQYSQHEASQPAVFTSWNLGPKWTSQWSSYVEDSGTAIWVIDHYDSYRNGDTVVYYPVWKETGGCLSGPLPITHLGGGGVESYQATCQLNSFVPPYGASTASIYFSYAAPDQPVVYEDRSVPVDQGGTIPPGGGDPTRPFLVRPRLVQTGDTSYKRYLPDGSVETYGHSDQASYYPRRIFLTERADASGNTLKFSYDGQQRLIAVTDALGQVTTLSYELGTDPLKVTKVTDPFGRSCQLGYNADGQLTTIIDTAGIQSSFTYADNDFIDSLTTPYGTTTFAFADVTTDPTMGVAAWLEATDQYGDTERAEFRHNAPGIPYSESIVPQTIPTFNAYINARNTYYWDKKAYQEAKGGDGSFDYNKAHIFHFLHSTDTNVCSGILESTKLPLENRVWLSYQNQPWAGGITYGMSTQPAMVARVLDDGSTQLSQYQYNDQQRVTKETDPLGRETTYTYDTANNIDLLEVALTTGGMHERVAAVDHYNAAHQPLGMLDAAGQKTVLTYNDFGQPATTTDPLGRVTTFVHDSQGYLTEIDGFDPALKSLFTYDGFGRLASTTTYPDAYTIQVGYDAIGGDPLKTLNRPQTATYPDGSFTEVLYNNLDMEWTRDRGGNWTHQLNNRLRQIEATIDPLGQITQFGYCKCGRMVSITDPNGNVTQWKLDAAERPYAKVYADNTEVTYTYENTTSRLKTTTDAKGQKTNYSYYLDGALQGVSYTQAEHATPGVSYVYDPLRGRLSSMVDGVGSTVYSYYPYGNGGFGPLGAGRLQSVSGPFDNQTTSFEYDQLGRTIKRTVNGVDESYAFDSLGRLQSDTNALGAFTYGYEGVTGRLSGVSYPNGQQALYSYLGDNAQDRRLSQIKHLAPSGATLDQFDYTYDGPLGRIAHWGQQQPGTTNGSVASSAYDLGYDAIGQLKHATLNGDGSNPGSGVWRYDDAGNRTGVQAGSGVLTTAVPTSTNALFSLRGGGKVRVAGTLDKWAAVTVNGSTASVDAGSNTFEAAVPAAIGAQTLTINATDASGNVATSRYQLSISAGVEEDFSYDLNGNTTALTPVGAAPAQSLEWDALDQVTAIIQGSHRSEFGYDGNGNRVRITEKDAGQVVSDRLYVAGEERDAANGQVLRRFFAQGEQRVGGSATGSYFYADDHLGSTRELTDSAGAVQASYGYEPWGNRTKLQGSLDTEAGFTGYWHHAASGLEMSPTRLYQPSLGKFISEDPIAESGGINLYAYCGNNPISRVDPMGLSWGGAALGLGAGLVVGVGAALLFPGFAAGLLGAMVIGALSGLAADLASQLYDNGGCFRCINWGQALQAAALGALFGQLGHEFGPYIGAALRGAARYIGGILEDASRALRGWLGGLCFVAGTTVLATTGRTAVENVHVGDRVVSRDGNEIDSEVDPTTWKEVTLQMQNSEVAWDTYDIHALRSPEWLAREGCSRIGDKIWFEMDEVGLHGWARVKEVADCPTLASGAGNVVLATFSHFNNDVYRLRLEGVAEPLEPTGLHRLYSATRGAWVATRSLQVGEWLRTRDGEKRVESIEREVGTQRVYNLEVEREHCYFVGDTQVLAHNSCELPSQGAAYRAAMRNSGIGANGARTEATVPLRPGSQSPTGAPGVRTEWTNPDNGAVVHHDPYGNYYGPESPNNIGPHYGVEFPNGPTEHFPYASNHNPSLNR